jgi:hypothetical protein
MSNENTRVLSRRGARQLSQDETEQIMGSKLTLATALPTLPVNNPDTMLDQ